jgi:hypothetical protein
MISDKAKAAILDRCCQKVDCLARGEVIDLEGALDASQTSPETETVTGSWSTDQELIALCMDMLGDVPGETLDQRVEKLVSYHLELQLLHGNEVQRSLNLEMGLNQCRGHAQRPNQWKCLAPSKAACAWPDCGCDPAATHVIQALVDQGWHPPSPDTSTDRTSK